MEPTVLDKRMSALDRCDKCGARAYFRATMLSGLDLTFCLHHGSEYAEAIVAQGVKVFEDHTNLLDEEKYD